MTDFSHRSNFKPLQWVTCLISVDCEFSIEIGSVAELKTKNFDIVNRNTTHIDFAFKFQYHHLGISYLIAIQNENRIIINLCLFEFFNKFAFLRVIVSVQTPNLLNIYLWCRRRSFLCVNAWPISVADFQV
jgi:hypothetical protein